MQNYNFLDKSLHNFILKNPLIKKTLFELEKMIFLRGIDDTYNQEHIYISSLPRSGTTAILEFFYNSNNYASLTYADMPFVLCPNLFKIFNTNKTILKKERAHKDGIFIGINSPESFDDVFFQMQIDNNDFDFELRNYIKLILKKYNRKKYLSKNNNNYLRFDKLSQAFPKSKFIVPFRDPLQQANSLLKQHLSFLKIQKENRFALEYMNSLGHFEFGQNHKPWATPLKYKDKESINYWLEQWFEFYRQIVEKSKDNNRLEMISYDLLCRNESYLKNFCKNNNLDFKDDYFYLPKKIRIQNYDIDLYNNCLELMKKMISFNT
jgi:hypothetical protein